MNKEINKKLAELKYNPTKILSVGGDESIPEFCPNVGSFDQQKYIVVHKEEASLSTENAELSVLENLENSVYPGAIVLANRALMENSPTVLAFPRRPMTFRIDLPGLGQAGTFTIENPTQSALEAKVDEIFTLWCDKYSRTHQIAATIKYRDTMAYSESQVSAALNLDYKAVSTDLGIDFKAISEGKKSVMICQYEQVFYSVKCEKPAYPAEFFADSVTWEDLVAKGISNTTPPAYVHSASYGRRIFVKMESRSTSAEVEAALRASMKDDFNIKMNAKYKEILENTSMSVIVLGGGVQYATALIEAKDLKMVRSILAESAVCGKDNPGRLFSYACNFLKDDAAAVVRDTSKYIETTCTEYMGGTITLEQTGGYVAYFIVTWKKREYNKAGKLLETPGEWHGNGKRHTSPFSEDIYLDGSCYDIKVEAWVRTGLAWEQERKVIDVSGVPLIPKRKFHIGGTTLNTTKSITPPISQQLASAGIS